MNKAHQSPKRSRARLLLTGAIVTSALSIGAISGTASAATVKVETSTVTVKVSLPVPSAALGIRW